MKKFILIILFYNLIYGCSNYDLTKKQMVNTIDAKPTSIVPIILGIPNQEKSSSNINYAPSPYPSGLTFPYSKNLAFNGFDGYIVQGTEEIKKEGYFGSYLDIYSNVMPSLLKSLDINAKLIYSSGTTDEYGKTIEKTAYPGLEAMFESNPTLAPVYNWLFIYVSESKKEVYNISINYKETVIHKEKWVINGLNNEIKIDSVKAIELLKNAIKDKNFISKDIIGNPKEQFISSAYGLPKQFITNVFIEKYLTPRQIT